MLRRYVKRKQVTSVLLSIALFIMGIQPLNVAYRQTMPRCAACLTLCTRWPETRAPCLISEIFKMPGPARICIIFICFNAVTFN